ncbi:cysteine-rich CWC family protein [Zhongshania borealis]|uniref:cysteine-rich CWC family protein n=1 Tax=Zhongshania borealis TaxID=889488 RepID=UPI003CD061C2
MLNSPSQPQSPSPTSAVSAAQCPLCGQTNQCAIAAGNAASSCWCMNSTFSGAAKQQAANTQGPQRCICKACGQVSTE